MAEKRTVGDRIAALRHTYDISREALAQRSGLNVDLIEKIEGGEYIPDLAPLIKIARALGVRLGTFMDDHEELGPIVCRRGQGVAGMRFSTGIKPRDLTFSALAAGKAGRHMEPFIVDVSAKAQGDRSTHEGEEFIYVLDGSVVLEYGLETYELTQGDSAYYDSIVPHRVVAPQTGRLLAVVYAPF